MTLDFNRTDLLDQLAQAGLSDDFTQNLEKIRCYKHRYAR